MRWFSDGTGCLRSQPCDYWVGIFSSSPWPLGRKRGWWLNQLLTDNDLINYDCAVAVCVYVRKAPVNTQKDRVQRTFWLVNTQIWGAWCVRRRQGSSTYFLYTFSVDLFHLGVSELCACVRSQSYLTLCDPLETVAHQAPLSMGFSRQEYCSGFSCPPSRDLPNPGMESASLASLPLTGGFFIAPPPGKFLSYILL